jgi:hypothetical protein
VKILADSREVLTIVCVVSPILSNVLVSCVKTVPPYVSFLYPSALMCTQHI